MPENHDKIFTILLDVQKQMGNISRETGEQTKKLESLNDKQAVLSDYQKEANGKMAKTMERVMKIEDNIEDYQDLKLQVSDVLTTKKALIIVCTILITISGAFWGITKYAAKSYLREILSEEGYNNVIIDK